MAAPSPSKEKAAKAESILGRSVFPKARDTEAEGKTNFLACVLGPGNTEVGVAS